MLFSPYFTWRPNITQMLSHLSVSFFFIILFILITESLVFIKRMMAVAVSSITYLRGIFPEDAYRSRYLEDLCIKVLREDCNTPGASKVVKWLMGCFDAIEKQYVYTNPDKPNVTYQFKFRYTEKGPVMDLLRFAVQVTLEDTKRASVLLIRKLFLLMQNLDSLPSNVYLTMKLFYYDDSKICKNFTLHF
uniref:Zebrafish testis-expressed 38 n=1 Tax=Echeneis naucrates TaxID=173247 RepID=A0A665VKF8_ECHNA